MNQEFLEKGFPHVSGWLRSVGTLIFTANSRYYQLDAKQGSFARYNKPEDCPRRPAELIRLREIYEVKKLNRAWYQKKGYYYFEICYSTR